jgi:hypothetical protein
MISRTTWAGALAAVGTAIAAIDGLPPKFRLAALALSACGTACLGYWAADSRENPKPPLPLFLLLAVLTVVLTTTACTIAGLKASAVIPTFGEYSLEVTSGSIGRAPTNQPPPTINTNTP